MNKSATLFKSLLPPTILVTVLFWIIIRMMENQIIDHLFYLISPPLRPSSYFGLSAILIIILMVYLQKKSQSAAWSLWILLILLATMLAIIVYRLTKIPYVAAG